MNKIIKYINSYNFKKPDICIILGSGLNSFIDNINNKITINYNDIPDFSNTSVEGHSGQLIIGDINKINVMCASGRLHYYEGHSFKKVGEIVQLFNSYSPDLCIITNSSGCLDLNWKLGTLMLADQFIDYSFINSDQPKFHKLKSKKYFNKILSIAKNNNIEINKGAYTYTTGPTYETAAEINDIVKLGGKAVGMSTFPEFLECEKLAINNVIISCLTNYGAGLVDNKKIKHDDVLQNAKKFENLFNKLLIKFITSMSHPKIPKR